MTITDDYIDALIAEHYPAHTSPMAEIHHRESIRAIVEAVAGMRWRPISELPELEAAYPPRCFKNQRELLVWDADYREAAFGKVFVDSEGQAHWKVDVGESHAITHWCEIDAPDDDG